MESNEKDIKLTKHRQRILLFLFKFRFVSARLLAIAMHEERTRVYRALEYLVAKGLVTKVYDSSFRIDRKPAYYYLSTAGVTKVRHIMDVDKPVVHPLYKNDTVSQEFIEHCLQTIDVFNTLRDRLPEDTGISSKSEINQYQEFPKTRPDLYIRTPEDREAIIVILDDLPKYLIRKRLDEIILHCDEEGWDGDYPVVGVIVKDDHTARSLNFTTRRRLDTLGMDEDDIIIRITSLTALEPGANEKWLSPFSPPSGSLLP